MQLFPQTFAYTNKKSFLCSEKQASIIYINNLKLIIMSEIEARVKAIIVDKLGVDESEVVPTASFTNDLGADSLDTVELMIRLRKSLL